MELLSSVFSWFSGHHSQQQKEILREKNKDRNINFFYWSFLVTFQKIILSGSRTAMIRNLEAEDIFHSISGLAKLKPDLGSVS